jgi:hypothetical protein
VTREQALTSIRTRLRTMGADVDHMTDVELERRFVSHVRAADLSGMSVHKAVAVLASELRRAA